MHVQYFRYGRINILKRLLKSEKGSFIINESNGEGLTALHIASKQGEILRQILLFVEVVLEETIFTIHTFHSLTLKVLQYNFFESKVQKMNK